MEPRTPTQWQPDVSRPAQAGTESVKRLSDSVRERSFYQADQTKTKIAGALRGIVEEVESMAGSLAEKNPGAGQIAGRAAEALRRFNERLERQTTGELLEDTRENLKRHPGPWIAGLFALGFLGARLMKR